MVKSIQSSKKKLQSQPMEAVGVPMPIQEEVRSGQSGGSATSKVTQGQQPLEEQSSASTLTIYSAPVGPVFTLAIAEQFSSASQSEDSDVGVPIHSNSKKIRKSNLSRRANQQPQQQQLHQVLQRLTLNQNERPPARRQNHARHSVKKPYSVIRKVLKKYKFNKFYLYESKGNDRRGCAGIVPWSLLELYYLVPDKQFEAFQQVRKGLDKKLVQLRKDQEMFGENEKRSCDIKYFENAQTSLKLFIDGYYHLSIQVYHGQGKEKKYLNQVWDQFIERRRQLEQQRIFDVLAL